MSVLKIFPEDTGISMLPLHHTYESTIILFFAPYCGCKVTFCEGFKYVLRNMKEFSPSIFVAVPLILETVHRRLMQRIKAKPHGEFLFKFGTKVCKVASKVGIDLRKVFFKEIQDAFGGNMRLIICGAAPIRPEILRDFEAFGIQILFGYGLTECSPIVICNSDDDRKASSIGKPLDEVQVKIINKDSQGIGEICVKGPMVMLGYYNNPTATDEVLVDGYLHTGDLGYCDDKGYYYITGRSKNVIVTSTGKNIYPEEIESMFYSYDTVQEVVVSAAESDVITVQIFPELSEIEKKLKRKNLTDNDIKKALNEVVRSVNKKLPSYKRVRKLIVRKEGFAKTTTHKIKRYDENANDNRSL